MDAEIEKLSVKNLLGVIQFTQQELTKIFVDSLCRDIITDLPTITRTKDLIDHLKQFEHC